MKRTQLAIVVGEDKSGTVVIGGAKVEVSADGSRITACTNGVERKAPATADPAAEGAQIKVSKGFNAVILNGVTIQQASDGYLVITTPGKVSWKAPPRMIVRNRRWAT